MAENETFAINRLYFFFFAVDVSTVDAGVKKKERVESLYASGAIPGSVDLSL